MEKIVILDYGMGNLASVEKAFRFLGKACEISNDFANADRLVIPGVGAFGAAMQKLEPLKPKIKEFAASNRPILGICLGQQLLFDRSEEHGSFDGLGLIPGSVRYLPFLPGIKIPHIGWNRLHVNHPKLGLVNHLVPDSQVYFVHSLYTECENPSDVVATTNHGIDFPSIVAHGSVWGCQFHPEKSGEVGLLMLKAFAEGS